MCHGDERCGSQRLFDRHRGRALAAAGLATLLAAAGCAGNRATSSDARSEPVTAPAESTPPTATLYDREKALESFEVVWKTVNEKHWDPAHGGVDWQAVHDEFRPKVETATTMAEARRAMGDMLERLGQSHFGIWPQEIYTRDDASTGDEAETRRPENTGAATKPTAARADADRHAEAGTATTGRGATGLDIRVVGNDAMVTRVIPGSPAAIAGVQPGWLLLGADGKTLQELSQRLDARGSQRHSKELALGMILQHMLEGDAGDVISGQFVDGSGQTVTRDITLAAPSGTAATIGNLPIFFLEIESKRLPENVEYFRFSMFMDPPRLMGAFQKSVESAKDADGFIIDLRGNPGGIGGLAMGMGGWFVDDDSVKLGTMTTRAGVMNFVLNPRVRAYKGPLAILIDGMSGSTSEILAGGMKDIGRARIFGQRSAGAALPSVIDRLPNGDRFQYAIANYVSAGGEELEAHGVAPDEVVAPDRSSLLAGRDPVIEAAIRWIETRKGQPDATKSTAAGTNNQ